MSLACGHLLCELIGDGCSLAIRRSRGCRSGLGEKAIAPEVFDEVAELLAVIDPGVRPDAGPAGGDERVRAAAIRLAAIVRRQALEDRHLIAHARMDEPELVPALERLCSRRG